MTIAGYVRVSSRRQRDESDSPENQEAMLRAAGCTKIYCDLAVSGYSYAQRRKASDYTNLLNDIRSGEIKILKTLRIDRIARRDELIMEIVKACEESDVLFESLASGAHDTKTPSNWLNVKMQIVMAEFYSRQLSQSVKSSINASLSRGVACRSSQCLPFHLAREPGTKYGVIAGPLFDLAREQVLLLGEGRTTITAASIALGTSAKTISRWLRRPVLLGHVTDRNGKILLRNCWPALVTRDEQEKAITQVLSRRSRWGINATGHRKLHALSGLVYCLYCKSVLSHSANRNRLYLRCYGAQCIYGTKSIQSHRIEQPLIINHVLPYMEKIATSITKPIKVASPDVAEWRRELRFREATPQEYLLPHDRERIVELQGLIAMASELEQPQNDADFARICLMLTDVTLGEGSWFSREEADRNRDLRQVVSRVDFCMETRTIMQVRFRVPN